MRHWLQAEQECRTTRTESASSETTRAASAPSTDSDVRPLQGTRAAAAANRTTKRGTNSPFPSERNPVGNGESTQAPAKRRTASTPAL